MSYVTYTTNGGERWDYISYIMYGDPFKAGDIIAANPAYSIYDVFPSGVLLNIPVIERPVADIDVNVLPPWKR